MAHINPPVDCFWQSKNTISFIHEFSTFGKIIRHSRCPFFANVGKLPYVPTFPHIFLICSPFNKFAYHLSIKSIYCTIPVYGNHVFPLNCPLYARCVSLAPLKIIAFLRQASYWMLVKKKGCFWVGYHGCITPSFLIIISITIFPYLYIYLFFWLSL